MKLSLSFLIFTLLSGLAWAQQPGSVSSTLARYKGLVKPPDVRELNDLTKQIQKLTSGVQLQEGGNISGGSDERVPFNAPAEDIENLRAFQKSVLGLDKLQSSGYKGSKYKVAILDSGISPDSSAARNVNLFKDFTGHCPANTLCDESLHGTLVADLITQAAPEAQLVVLKTLNHGASGSFENLIQALKWLVSNHKKMNIKVVNLSLTSPERITGEWNDIDKARALVQKLDENGVLVVSAVGNKYKKQITLFPASSPNVISVGSFAHQFSEDPSQRILSSFSDYGVAENPKVEHSQFLFFESTSRNFNAWVYKPEALAPGEQIIACGAQCEMVAGTSFAAGSVAGGLLSLLDKHPDLNRATFLNLLKSAPCNRPAIFSSYDSSRACAIAFSAL